MNKNVFEGILLRLSTQQDVFSFAKNFKKGVIRNARTG